MAEDRRHARHSHPRVLQCDAEIVWDVVQNKLTGLKTIAETLLAEDSTDRNTVIMPTPGLCRRRP